MTRSSTSTQPSHQELLTLATQAAHHAYVPYSEFPVGAAFVTDDGTVFTGCNVENAAYPLTLCAERNAVTTMVAATLGAPDTTANLPESNYSDPNHPEANFPEPHLAESLTSTKHPASRRINTVAIVGLKAAPCWPCGACRQVLREFGCSTVVVANEKGEPMSMSFEELLPHSFGPEHLS